MPTQGANIPADSWINIVALFSLEIGPQYVLHNNGPSTIHVTEQTTNPDDSTPFIIVSARNKTKINVENGVGVWVSSYINTSLIAIEKVGDIPITPISIGDGSHNDAYNRLRVSQPKSLHDWKNIHDRGIEFWNEETVGGGTIVHNPTKSQVELSVGTTSGDKAVRQSSRYYTYFPGKSQFISLTGVPGIGKENVRKRGGYFDDRNGVFFQFDGLSMAVVLRSDTSGSVIDTVIDSNNFNIDKMDGTGPSKQILDPSKANIFIIDFQWLGVGRIRYGVDINGVAKYIHEILNSNIHESAYMASGSLPLRYEIENTGISESPSTTIEICSSVVSEGGAELFGFDGVTSHGASPIIGILAKQAILAIRHVPTINGKKNRRTIVFSSMSAIAASKNAYIEIYNIKGWTSENGTWTKYDTDHSAVEYSIDITEVIGGEQKVFGDLYVAAGAAGKGGVVQTLPGLTGRRQYLSQNIDASQSDMFVIFATGFAASSDVAASIKWIEIE